MVSGPAQYDVPKAKDSEAVPKNSSVLDNAARCSPLLRNPIEMGCFVELKTST